MFGDEAFLENTTHDEPGNLSESMCIQLRFTDKPNYLHWPIGHMLAITTGWIGCLSDMFNVVVIPLFMMSLYHSFGTQRPIADGPFISQDKSS